MRTVDPWVLKHLDKMVANKDASILNPQEWRVIRLRFGQGQRKPMALQDIADRMGLSRERIRQIEYHSLKKVKFYLKGRNEKRVVTWHPASEPPETDPMGILRPGLEGGVEPLFVILTEEWRHKEEWPIWCGHYIPALKEWRIDGSPSKWEVSWWAYQKDLLPIPVEQRESLDD